MLTWYQKYKEANRETKLFIFNSIIYVAAIVLTTIYCYARLDFVRSYAPSAKAVEKSESKN